MCRRLFRSQEDIADYVLSSVKRTEHEYTYQQAIFISCILPHEINQGHSEEIQPLDQVVSINGNPIFHMWHIVEIIENLKADVEWITIELSSGKKFFFPKDEARRATDDLMQDNMITKQWDGIEMPV